MASCCYCCNNGLRFHLLNDKSNAKSNMLSTLLPGKLAIMGKQSKVALFVCSEEEELEGWIDGPSEGGRRREQILWRRPRRQEDLAQMANGGEWKDVLG